MPPGRALQLCMCETLMHASMCNSICESWNWMQSTLRVACPLRCEHAASAATVCVCVCFVWGAPCGVVPCAPGRTCELWCGKRDVLQSGMSLWWLSA